MSATLFVNIATLAGITAPGTLCARGAEMDGAMTSLSDAWLLVGDDGLFAGFGRMEELSPDAFPTARRVDVAGGCVLPSFCDSHTHIVYAGSREHEFVDKIKGLTYEQIAANGGGILNSADRLLATPEEELYRQAAARLTDMIMAGTGCVEIKSGYGLTLEGEMKILRVIRRLARTFPVKIKSTFLGAHAVGRAYKGRQQDYVDHVCRDMIPAAAPLSDFVDVFCDEGFFSPEQTRQIILAGAAYGLRPKIHANELAISGGVQVGVECGALSVDHLERMGDAELDLLAGSQTVATMLPGASFFLGMPYGKARQAISRDAILALASDFNPGSSPSGDMRFVMTLACVNMKLTVAEALTATTLNGAYAMGCADLYGSIAPGKVANFYVTHPLSSIDFIPYAYTTPVIRAVYLRGRRFPDSNS